MLIATAIVLAVVTYAAWHDLRTGEIPDVASVAVIVAALTVALTSDRPDWLMRLGGLGLGALVGCGLFAIGAWGGGDTKLLAALGAFVGVYALVPLLLWMALAGGAFSLIALARRRSEVIYGPAIAIGAWIVLLPVFVGTP